MKLVAIIALTFLSACAVPREARRGNRAANKVEKLVRKFPELRQNDTTRIPIELHIPAIRNVIFRPVAQPAQPLHHSDREIPASAPEMPQPFEIRFQDDTLDALFSYTTSGFALDYTIRDRRVNTIIKHISPTIQPTQTKFIEKQLGFWGELYIILGKILFWAIIVAAIFGAFKLFRK